MQGLLVRFQGNYKEYLFLDPQGLGNSLRVGDTIEDDRYTTPMIVVRIIHDLRNSAICTGSKWYTHSGIELKAINITKAPSHRFENKAKVAVPLSQAREWYKNGDSTLKKMALCVYTEDELEDIPSSFEEICERLNIVAISHSLSMPFMNAEKFGPKLSSQLKLMIVARYFNKCWKMRKGVHGYFIGMCSNINTPVFALGNSFGIFEHSTVVYPGVVYFKDLEDAKRAYKILGTTEFLSLI